MPGFVGFGGNLSFKFLEASTKLCPVDSPRQFSFCSLKVMLWEEWIIGCNKMVIAPSLISDRLQVHVIKYVQLPFGRSDDDGLPMHIPRQCRVKDV